MRKIDVDQFFQYPMEGQKNVHWFFGFYHAIIAFDLLYVLNLWVDVTIPTSRSINFAWMCGWDVTIQHQKHKIPTMFGQIVQYLHAFDT
jgi:hypothetical protein